MCTESHWLRVIFCARECEKRSEQEKWRMKSSKPEKRAEAVKSSATSLPPCSSRWQMPRMETFPYTMTQTFSRKKHSFCQTRKENENTDVRKNVTESSRLTGFSRINFYQEAAQRSDVLLSGGECAGCYRFLYTVIHLCKCIPALFSVPPPIQLHCSYWTVPFWTALFFGNKRGRKLFPQDLR